MARARKKSLVSFGDVEYRAGSMQRLLDAERLLRSESFAGCVYLGGRAVESMLRALLWKHDPDIKAGRKSLDTGHDLRELIARVRDLGLLREYDGNQRLADAVQAIGRLWFNNLRFASNKLVENWWRAAGFVTHKNTLKRAAQDYYNACALVVKQCEVIWQAS